MKVTKLGTIAFYDHGGVVLKDWHFNCEGVETTKESLAKDAIRCAIDAILAASSIPGEPIFDGTSLLSMEGHPLEFNESGVLVESGLRTTVVFSKEWK